MTSSPPKRRCPRCRSLGARRIVYGLPDASAIDDPDLHFAGCLVAGAALEWQCSRCGYEWSRGDRRPRHNVHVQLVDGEYLAAMTGRSADGLSAMTSAPTLATLAARAREMVSAAEGIDDFDLDFVFAEEILSEFEAERAS